MKAIMFGAASVDDAKHDQNGGGGGTPPTYATLWRVNAATPGLIATCAVLVHPTYPCLCS